MTAAANGGACLLNSDGGVAKEGDVLATLL